MSNDVKAITVCEPFAWLIVDNPTMPPKRVENRHARFPRITSQPLLIHSGKSKTFADQIATYRRRGIPVPNFDDISGRGLIGICECVDVVDLAEVPQQWRAWQFLPGAADAKDRATWIEGPRCLLLRHVCRFTRSIAYRGQQGVFGVPMAIVAEEFERFQERVAIESLR